MFLGKCKSDLSAAICSLAGFVKDNNLQLAFKYIWPKRIVWRKLQRYNSASPFKDMAECTRFYNAVAEV
jgi:hypothetical protein